MAIDNDARDWALEAKDMAQQANSKIETHDARCDERHKGIQTSLVRVEGGIQALNTFKDRSMYGLIAGLLLLLVDIVLNALHLTPGS